jgi:hypothetical protein
VEIGGQGGEPREEDGNSNNTNWLASRGAGQSIRLPEKRPFLGVWRSTFRLLRCRKSLCYRHFYL